MFVTFYFHDNDFANPIFNAMKALDYDYNLANFSERPEQLKEAICHLADGFAAMRSVMSHNSEPKKYIEYLKAHGRVKFTRETPENGGNYSAVSIDLNTHYIWTH